MGKRRGAEGVRVGKGVGVRRGVGEGMGVGVGEGMGVGVREGMGVSVGGGRNSEKASVGVSVGSNVTVGTTSTVGVGVGTNVTVGTTSAVGIGVSVNVNVSVGEGAKVDIGVVTGVGSTVDEGTHEVQSPVSKTSTVTTGLLQTPEDRENVNMESGDMICVPFRAVSDTSGLTDTAQ